MEYARIDSHRGQVTLWRGRLVGNDYCTNIVVICATSIVVVIATAAIIIVISVLITIVKTIAIALAIAVALFAGIVRHVVTIAT